MKPKAKSQVKPKPKAKSQKPKSPKARGQTPKAKWSQVKPSAAKCKLPQTEKPKKISNTLHYQGAGIRLENFRHQRALLANITSHVLIFVQRWQIGWLLRAHAQSSARVLKTAKRSAFGEKAGGQRAGEQPWLRQRTGFMFGWWQTCSCLQLSAAAVLQIWQTCCKVCLS